VPHIGQRWVHRSYGLRAAAAEEVDEEISGATGPTVIIEYD
jgi:hypothetical protein